MHRQCLIVKDNSCQYQKTLVLSEAPSKESGSMAWTSKGSQLGKLPLWPTDRLYHCRDFRYGPEHKKSGCHSPGRTE
ncbi:hypothetical protein TNCV_4374491 [Trichonephila clavipes]|uniref:Uncharacterized protein n=1 Tax=Trichonephila clavipes TaxID=2585209 RepID=A0A8X6R9I2_TRICX|nr:hypothetical protein TNCV_4374491 [Trichonephila clavipes]